MNRSLRRHHRQRIKQKVKDYYSGWPKSSPRASGMIATTRQLCSGPCCGNPRHQKKMIISETVYDYYGDKTVIHKAYTVSKKDRLTKQEKVHNLEFELNA